MRLFVLLEELKTFCFVFFCKMFHKRAKDHLQPNAPPAKRLRSNLADLFLSNNVSAQRTEEIFEDANLAGAAFCSDIGHPDSVAADPEKKKKNKNAHRDLLRKFLKGTEWPPLYWTKITTFDPKTEALVQSKVPLLLPHEIFGVFALPKIQRTFGQTGRICQKLL